MLCPYVVPRQLTQTSNGLFAPTRDGYAFEASAPSPVNVIEEGSGHWACRASARSPLPGGRLVARTTIRRRPGRWLLYGQGDGLFTGHLTLTWSERGVHYAVSVHTGEVRSGAVRGVLRAIASGMRPV